MMIRCISVTHNAVKKDEILYNSLYNSIDFDEKNKNVSRKLFDDRCPLRSLDMYYLDYRQWGRLYFIEPLINVPVLFECNNDVNVTYDSFITLLHKAYENLFNSDIAERLIAKDNMVCTYAEFTSFINADNANGVINKLRKHKFTEQQLNISEFDNYRLKNAYVTFTVNAIDNNTIRLCAKCPNTALKKYFNVDGLDNVGLDKVFSGRI